MLCRTHLASPTLNNLFPSLPRIQFICPTNTRTHTDLFTHMYTITQIHTCTHTKHHHSLHTPKHPHTETQTICLEACWSALAVPGRRMSCTLLSSVPSSQYKCIDLDPDTLSLSVKSHWEHVMKHHYHYKSSKWENAGGAIHKGSPSCTVLTEKSVLFLLHDI